jgi:hypothetical protein
MIALTPPTPEQLNALLVALRDHYQPDDRPTVDDIAQTMGIRVLVAWEWLAYARGQDLVGEGWTLQPLKQRFWLTKDGLAHIQRQPSA